MARITWLAAVLVFAAVSDAGAAGDSIAGKDLAVTWCSSCHLVDGRNRADDKALPFAAMARAAGSPERLRAFLVDPHGGMPPLGLGRQEIENLIAYIVRLGAKE